MYSVCVWSYCVFVILLVFYCVFVVLLVFYRFSFGFSLSLSLSLVLFSLYAIIRTYLGFVMPIFFLLRCC